MPCNLGSAYSRKGYMDKAIQAYDRSFETFPSFLMPLFNQALLLEQDERNGPAREAWEAYLKLAR